ncbi:hypothetical protein G9A89_014633 [Geosiphon pyriformis]|nr:hypothetical protein G9A89_014633 [Geosiphon pyriformis]
MDDDFYRNCPHSTTESTYEGVLCTACGLVTSKCGKFASEKEGEETGVQNEEYRSRQVVHTKKEIHQEKFEKRIKTQTQRICQNLNIQPFFNRIVAVVLEYHRQMPLLKGREETAAIGAATCLALREKGSPVTLNQVARTLSVEPGDLTAFFRQMMKKIKNTVKEPSVNLDILISAIIAAMFDKKVVNNLPLYTQESELTHLEEDAQVFDPKFFHKHARVIKRLARVATVQSRKFRETLSPCMKAYKKVLLGTSYALLEYASNAGIVTGRQPVPMAAAIILYAIEVTEKPTLKERTSNFKIAEEFVAYAFEIKADRVMSTRYRELRSLILPKVLDLPWAFLAHENHARAYLYVNDVIESDPPRNTTSNSNDLSLSQIPSIANTQRQRARRYKKLQKAKLYLEKEKSNIIAKRSTNWMEVVTSDNETLAEIAQDKEIQYLKKLLMVNFTTEAQLIDASTGLLEAWVQQAERGPITHDLLDPSLYEEDIPEDELGDYIKDSNKASFIQTQENLAGIRGNDEIRTLFNNNDETINISDEDIPNIDDPQDTIMIIDDDELKNGDYQWADDDENSEEHDFDQTSIEQDSGNSSDINDPPEVSIPRFEIKGQLNRNEKMEKKRRRVRLAHLSDKPPKKRKINEVKDEAPTSSDSVKPDDNGKNPAGKPRIRGKNSQLSTPVSGLNEPPDDRSTSGVPKRPKLLKRADEINYG